MTTSMEAIKEILRKNAEEREAEHQEMREMGATGLYYDVCHNASAGEAIVNTICRGFEDEPICLGATIVIHTTTYKQLVVKVAGIEKMGTNNCLLLTVKRS